MERAVSCGRDRRTSRRSVPGAEKQPSPTMSVLRQGRSQTRKEPRVSKPSVSWMVVTKEKTDQSSSRRDEARL